MIDGPRRKEDRDTATRGAMTLDRRTGDRATGDPATLAMGVR
jgi:hypothetical protein